MLTRREFQVYMLIVEGAKDRCQIALILGCAMQTVGSHTKRIMHKLGFTSTLSMLCAHHKAEMNF